MPRARGVRRPKVRCPTCQAVVHRSGAAAAPARRVKPSPTADPAAAAPERSLARRRGPAPSPTAIGAARTGITPTPWGLISACPPERWRWWCCSSWAAGFSCAFQATISRADQPRIAEKLRWEMDAKGKKEPWFGEKKGFRREEVRQEVFDDKNGQRRQGFEDKKVVDDKRIEGQEGSQGTAGVRTARVRSTGLPSP